MTKNRLFISILSALILCTAIPGIYGMESRDDTTNKKEVKSLKQLAAEAVGNHAEAIGLIDQLHRLPDELAIDATYHTPLGYFADNQDTIKQLIAKKKLNHSVLCHLLGTLEPVNEKALQEIYALARQLAYDGQIDQGTADILINSIYANADIDTLLQATNINELFNMLFPAEILQHDNDTVIWHALRSKIFASPNPLFTFIYPYYCTLYTTKDELFEPILQAQQQYRLQKQNDAEVILDEHDDIIASIRKNIRLNDGTQIYDQAIVSSDKRFAVLYCNHAILIYDLENQYAIMDAIINIDPTAAPIIHVAFDEENSQLIIKKGPGSILTCPLPQELVVCNFDLQMMNFLAYLLSHNNNSSNKIEETNKLAEKFLPTDHHACNHLFDLLKKMAALSLSQGRMQQIICEYLNINIGDLAEFVQNNPQNYNDNIQQLAATNAEFAQLINEAAQSELMHYKRGD